MSIRIKEIAFLMHPVADIARARRFYEGLLGLKIGFEMEFTPGVWWIEYDIAGVALGVSNYFPVTGTEGTQLVLEVFDLDDTLKQVHSAGIPLASEVQDFPPCRMFGIKSPDGYAISFHQMKPKA